jgi:hypothetical protein
VEIKALEMETKATHSEDDAQESAKISSRLVPDILVQNTTPSLPVTTDPEDVEERKYQAPPAEEGDAGCLLTALAVAAEHIAPTPTAQLHNLRDVPVARLPRVIPRDTNCSPTSPADGHDDPSEEFIVAKSLLDLSLITSASDDQSFEGPAATSTPLASPSIVLPVATKQEDEQEPVLPSTPGIPQTPVPIEHKAHKIDVFELHPEWHVPVPQHKLLPYWIWGARTSLSHFEFIGDHWKDSPWLKADNNNEAETSEDTANESMDLEEVDAEINSQMLGELSWEERRAAHYTSRQYRDSNNEDTKPAATATVARPPIVEQLDDEDDGDVDMPKGSGDDMDM